MIGKKKERKKGGRQELREGGRIKGFPFASSGSRFWSFYSTPTSLLSFFSGSFPELSREAVTCRLNGLASTSAQHLNPRLGLLFFRPLLLPTNTHAGWALSHVGFGSSGLGQVSLTLQSPCTWRVKMELVSSMGY